MDLELRPYQAQIIDSVKRNGNTLVVLPTGLGKTLIALSLIEKTHHNCGKSLFLTPTKPLARQHSISIKNILHLDESDVSLVTGETTGKKREGLYTSKIFVSTPQTIRNDIRNGIYPIEKTNFVVFDEAHRAVGDYAYVEIAKSMPENCLFLALTASPGWDRARIKEVLENLRIKNIEIRTENDPDIMPFMKAMEKNWVHVDLSPKLKEADALLSSMIKSYSQKLSSSFIKPPLASKQQFMLYGQRLRALRHPMKYNLLSNYYSLLHLLHMQELLQTQGPHPFLLYLGKLNTLNSKSAAAIAKSAEIAKIKQVVSSVGDHPKTEKLLQLLSTMRGKKIILFVQYRDQISRIKEVLDQNGYSSRIFVGKRDGFTRKDQEEAIDAFRRNEFDILISSSIGEEGLDIPAVDSVIFFEPIPSEIRSIQRRGRAGRFKDGSVHILITRATRDEYYYWASRKREQKMKEVLLSLQKELERKRPPPCEKEGGCPPAQQKGQTKLGLFV